MSPLAAVVSAGIAELVGSEALLAPGSVLADVLVWLLSFEFLPVHAAIEKAATSTSDIVIKRIESLSLYLERKVVTSRLLRPDARFLLAPKARKQAL
jgi:hypothetical protein